MEYWHLEFILYFFSLNSVFLNRELSGDNIQMVIFFPSYTCTLENAHTTLWLLWRRL